MQGKFGFFPQTLPNAYHMLQEMFSNFSEAQTFAGGTNIRPIQETASDMRVALPTNDPR